MAYGIEGKVAVVTGSAKGIGAAIAVELARCGANVVVNYNNSEAEARAVIDVVRLAGVDARLVQGDVAKADDCEKIADAAIKAWGRIDILVNNAGTTKFASHSDLSALTADDFSKIYAVNVIGAFQMAKTCCESLKQGEGGAIVNISSIAGIYGVGSSIAYAASKGALNTMTLSMARAFAPSIRVNAVCPGFVATTWFSDRFGSEAASQVAAQQKELAPLKDTASAEDVAKVVCFLAGTHAKHITGETLLVDGGLHLGSVPSGMR